MTIAETFTAAVAAFKEARAVEVAYDRDFWTPVHQANEAGGPAIPADIDAEMERLQELRCTLEEAWILVEAPDFAAVGEKLVYMRARWDQSDVPASWWDAIIADVSAIQTRFAETWLARWLLDGGSVTFDHQDDSKALFGFPTYDGSPEYAALSEGQRESDHIMSSMEFRYYGRMNGMIDDLKLVPGGVDIIKAHMRVTGRKAIYRPSTEGAAA